MSLTTVLGKLGKMRAFANEMDKWFDPLDHSF